MQKFWNWVHDDSGGRVLRLEGPIDSDSFWGDEITPQMFRDELYAEEGDITLGISVDQLQRDTEVRETDGFVTMDLITGSRQPRE